MIILDTDVLTHVLLGKQPVSDRVVNAARSEAVAITIVTRLEVLGGRASAMFKATDGAALMNAAARFADSEAALAAFEVAGFDQSAADRFDHLLGVKSVRKVGRHDMLIAAIALARGALLVTRNRRDFLSVPGLRFENWVD